MEALNNLAVKNVREYLQIPSVHPNVDYNDCIKFLEKMGKSLDLPVQVIFLKPTKPVVIITWIGLKPDLQSILLNSHMDVVPAFEEQWKHKPFSAEIEGGKIYARGTQDMKCIGIQYLEAIRRLKLEGQVFLRTIHVSFVPDEEIGGMEGMNLFIQTQVFREMNVGVSLDESHASKTNEFVFFYGEKNCWQFTIHCEGSTGHTSLLLENTPGEKISYILNKANDYRNSQKKLIEKYPTPCLDNITSINCTKIRGGVQVNVIPCEMAISFDCRIPSSYCVKEFEEMINQWCREAGEGCYIEYHQKDEPVLNTQLNKSNIFWNAFERAVQKLRIHLNIEICSGTTDSRYLRKIGIPAFGFSPINNTPILLHSHDEFLGEDTFLNGIEIYRTIIAELASVE